MERMFPAIVSQFVQEPPVTGRCCVTGHNWRGTGRTDCCTSLATSPRQSEKNFSSNSRQSEKFKFLVNLKSSNFSSNSRQSEKFKFLINLKSSNFSSNSRQSEKFKFHVNLKSSNFSSI